MLTLWLRACAGSEGSRSERSECARLRAGSASAAAQLLRGCSRPPPLPLRARLPLSAWLRMADSPACTMSPLPRRSSSLTLRGSPARLLRLCCSRRASMEGASEVG
jgi:hypothetical protein